MDEETAMYLQSLQGGAPAQGFSSFGWGGMGGGMSGPSMSGTTNFLAAPSSQSLMPASGAMPAMGGGLNWGASAQPQGFLAKAGSWLSNGNNAGTLVQGLGTLTNAYLGYQQLKQAKQAFGLQKEMANANLVNSIASYNTSLEDRIRGRTADYGGKENDVQSYLAKHSLKR